jgi:hypothetical protein
VSQLKVSLVAAAAAAFLAACGGSGGGSGDVGTPTAPIAPTPPLASTTGVAVDGYLSGSTVLCDTNANGRLDANEVTTTTNTVGAFTFDPGCAAPLVITGGTNVDTGFAFVGQLQAPAGAIVVTPLTTLMVVGNMTAAQVATALGLPAGTDPTRVDPANGANPELFKATLAVQQVLQQLAKTFSANDSADARNAVYTVTATKLAEALTATNAPRLVGNDGSVNITLLKDVVIDVAATLNTTVTPLAVAGIADQIATQAESFVQSDGTLDALTRAARLVQAPEVVIDVRAADNNFTALAAQGLSLNGQPVSLAEFAGPNGVSVTDFRELGLSFEVVGSPSVSVVSSIAMELSETVANNPRRLQVMIDKVNISYNSGTRTWSIAPAVGAKVHVYGRQTNGTEVETTLNDLSFAPVETNGNRVTIKYQTVLNRIFSSNQSSQLGFTAQQFMNIKGSFDTTLVVSRLNLRRADGSALPLQDVQLPGSDKRVTGVGVKGKVTFN